MSPAAAPSPSPRELLPVFNALPGAYMLLTPELLIEAASDEYLAATLTTREQLVGRLVFDAFPDNPDAPEAYATGNLRASLEQVLATGQPHQMAPQHYDVPDPKRPGHFVERHWLCTNRPVLGADGRVTHLLHAAVDITDQGRTERALRASQAAEQAARAEVERQRAELERLFEQAPVALAVFQGPQYKVELANPHVLRLWGRTREQALHTPLFELLPEAAGQGFEELLDQVMATGVPHVAHERPSVIDRDGRRDTVYWNFVYQPLRQEDGQITGVTVVATEVSEQVRARQQVQQLNQELEARVAERTLEVEAARREAEQARQRLAQAFQQAPFYLNLYRGPEHVFELVHPFTQELFGDRVLVGRPRREALSELGEDTHWPFDLVYATGQAQHQPELRTTIAHDGDGQLREVYFDIVYQPLLDAEGRVEGVLTLSVDATERVRTRQQAEALQADLLTVAQRLAREREAFHNVFEQTPALIALLRAPEHRYEYVNPAYQHLMPGRQLVGLPIAEAVPEAQEQGFVDVLDRVYQTGETFFGAGVPYTVVPTDGGTPERHYFNFTYQAYREEGRIAGVTIFAFDVTEQVEARQQREAERQQLHTLFMEAPAPIVILNGPELVFQLVNPAYQRVFPGRTLLGKPVLDALPEVAGTDIYHSLERVYDTGESFVAQEQSLQLARHEDGPLEELFFTFTYQARRNAQGEVDGVLVFAHEVTDQVQARHVVEARETSFHLLADQVPSTLWVTDPAGACTYLNARWYATTGQTQPEGLGLGWTNAVHPDDAAGAGAAFLSANARREPFSCLFRLRQRDGAYRWVIDQGLPHFSATGAYDGMVGTVVDVHEQKLAELALQRLTAELGATNEQLTRTNVDLDNFIYTASHDLRVPIVNIEGLLHAIARELPPTARVGAVPEMLQLMQDSVNRFKRTISHLTDVSKLQQAHGQPNTEVLLAAVVEEVRLDLQPLVQQTQAQLTVDVPASAHLPFSEKNLRSVVYNLLSNALKYHHPDRPPHVQLSYHRKDPYHVLRVQDNGLGFDVAKSAGKLFGMFRRLHTHVEGTGIGLYMVKKMVENSGGRIDVASQPGEGTTFTVFFPVHPAS